MILMKSTTSTFLLFIIWLVADQVLHAQQPPSPADEACQSILEVTSSSTEPDCQPLGDCTGLSCYSSTSNKTVEITVNKCTDPLVVNVTVYDGMQGSTVYITQQVTGVGDIGNSGFTVDTFTRDDFTAMISVSYMNNGVSAVAVPTSEIPLNASYCACMVITATGANVEAPAGSTVSCEVNEGCTGQECDYSTSGLTFLFESEIISCNNPPGFEVIIRTEDGTVVSEHYFDEDGNITILSILPLRVTVEQRDYSIIIDGILLFSNQWYQVIPRAQIMLDKSECIPPMPPTTSTPTGMVPQATSDETCAVLKNISATTNTNVQGLAVCSVNSACDTVSCIILNEYESSYHLLSCKETPGVHVMFKQGDNVLYNHTITDSAEDIFIDDGAAKITIDVKQKEKKISIKVDVNLGFQAIPIIPLTDVPIDKCYCSKYSDSEECKEDNSQRAVRVAVAVAVPIVVVILLAIVVVIVTLVACSMIKKSSGKSSDDTVTFQQMKNEE